MEDLIEMKEEFYLYSVFLVGIFELRLVQTTECDAIQSEMEF